MIFSTIISPEKDGIIQAGSFNYLIKSIDQNYGTYDLDIKYRNIDAQVVNLLATNASNISLSRICNADYIVGKNREYFKLKNFIEVFQKSRNELICFLDIDTLVVNKINLELDFDIAFTLKDTGRSHTQITNTGIFFVNKTKTNAEIISKFLMDMILSTRSLDKSNKNSVNFWKFMSFPEKKTHLQWLDDYIVSQDFINSICFSKQWFEAGLYDLDGLKFKIIDSTYNKQWNFGQEYDDKIFIYHFKGRRENKVERAKKLKELYVSYKK